MWDLWWTKWHWDGFSLSTSVFPCQFHSTGAPLLGKMKKLIIVLFIFITTELCDTVVGNRVLYLEVSDLSLGLEAFS
jgi:hypothetical protein